MVYNFVDIEATSYCNAKCPFCNRTNMELEKKHLDIEVIKKLPFENIKTILLLGNKGDAIFYPKLFELIKYVIGNYKTWVQIHTNASAHSREWWGELSTLLQGQGAVVYALDGLEDTHKLHRIGTNFNKIVENITEFNRKGGKSLCQFLKFKHNENQLNELRELVTSIGSEKLWVRKSRGFSKKLERPSGAKTRFEINRDKDSKISCVFLKKPSFVLTVDGEIRPCCFMADDNYFDNFLQHLRQDSSYPSHIIAYRKKPESINLRYFTFDEIMKADYYRAIKRNYKYLYRCNEKCKATFEDIVDEEIL